MTPQERLKEIEDTFKLKGMMEIKDVYFLFSRVRKLEQWHEAILKNYMPDTTAYKLSAKALEDET